MVSPRGKLVVAGGEGEGERERGIMRSGLLRGDVGGVPTTTTGRGGIILGGCIGYVILLRPMAVPLRIRICGAPYQPNELSEFIEVMRELRRFFM